MENVGGQWKRKVDDGRRGRLMNEDVPLLLRCLYWWDHTCCYHCGPSSSKIWTKRMQTTTSWMDQIENLTKQTSLCTAKGRVSISTAQGSK